MKPMKLKNVIIYLLIFFCFCIITLIIHLAIKRKARPYDAIDEIDKIDAYAFDSRGISEKIPTIRFVENPENMRQLEEMKKKIIEVNERQHIYNRDNYTGVEFDHTVLVIRVHPNITYLAVFFDSISHIYWIKKSLLIFAHDYYDDDTNAAITTLRFARVMQIFYPYSTQLHPNTYPGEDYRFCAKLDKCVDSRKRDPLLSEQKLFWWWIFNQVFDHIAVLRNYNGYIYFLDTKMYLTRDFIHTAKVLEYHQPTFCPDCNFLSMGMRPPRAQFYHPRGTSMIISAWGYSNYSDLGIGFNRTTWNIIKNLKKQYCYFRDPSWVSSLKHLATKTHENQFYMLSIGAPRFFPTDGCGISENNTRCDLNSVYLDILKFLPKIRRKEYAKTFSVKFDALLSKYEVEPRGQWGDARDINLCMFFSGKGRRIYY